MNKEISVLTYDELKTSWNLTHLNEEEFQLELTDDEVDMMRKEARNFIMNMYGDVNVDKVKMAYRLEYEPKLFKNTGMIYSIFNIVALGEFIK